MSIYQEQVIECPNCKHENEFVIWKSFNCQESAEYLDDFLNGKFFKFTCKHCGYVSTVSYQMLYHDPFHNVIISFDDPENNSEYNENEHIEAGHRFTKMGYQHRIVNSVSDLLEKALIFHEGYDDRVIEIEKCFSLEMAKDSYPDLVFNDCRFLKKDNECFLILLGDTPMMSPVTEENCKETYSKYLLATGMDKNNEYHVDLNWAYKLLLNFC